MKVVLAEKPSVARDLASFLRASSRRDGYFEGSGYQVTWALGHLAELKEPADYDPALKKWSLETLPFVPETFELKLRGDKRACQQFAVVKRLFKAADELICATDAGREGELIFRYILTLAGCTHKPSQRLWLSSLTPQAIRTAFRSMRPLADYDNLYAAAKCRSEADWIVGLNATRNYTVRFGSAGILWSLGRVQTPVLAMIVRRDDEIRTFKPQSFWELMTDHHAIIPTGTVPGTLSERDQKVYQAVLVRLIAAFYPPCVKQVTTVDGVAQEVPFRARGVRVTAPGWTELYPRQPGRWSGSTDDGEVLNRPGRLPPLRREGRGAKEVV